MPDLFQSYRTHPPEGWAINRQQRQHYESLQRYGERVLLKRVWRVQDFAAGLVRRCSHCHGGQRDVQLRASSVYKQSGDSRCQHCYGVGFDGGFDPVTYVTYMIAADNSDKFIKHRTGEMIEAAPAMQFPHWPLVNEGDLIVTVKSWDGETPVELGVRFLMSTVTVQTIRKGIVNAYSPDIIIGQSTTLHNIVSDHEYYNVDIL